MKTKQIDTWTSEFGAEYTERNTYTPESWDQFYIQNFGATKLEMNSDALKDIPRNIKILEVGCNIGLQLIGLQRMGFTQLYGIELQQYAVEKSKFITTNIQIIQGSGFDIPFRDEYFDLVCTNGVLIHIDPQHHREFLSEIVRCSSRYIMGFEYFSTKPAKITYRGKENLLWKNNFSDVYTSLFPSVQKKYEKIYPYICPQEAGNKDTLFLLEKIK